LAEHEYGLSAPQAPWECAAAVLADQAFRDLDVLRSPDGAILPLQAQDELEEGEVPPQVHLALRTRDLAAWYSGVVEPLLEDEEAEEASEGQGGADKEPDLAAQEAPPRLQHPLPTRRPPRPRKWLAIQLQWP